MSNCAVTQRELPYLEPSKKNAHYVVVSEKVLKKKGLHAAVSVDRDVCPQRHRQSVRVCVCVCVDDLPTS